MNCIIVLFFLSMGLPAVIAIDRVCISDNKTSFVLQPSNKSFLPWGVNYDHDDSGRLLDEYWIDEWQAVVDDFQEIKSLGANCVRIHLQFGKFMDAPDKPNASSLEQLAKLLQLAENHQLYLDITGLACYHKANVPEWYDALSESDRWTAQAKFWEAIANTCKESPTVFCYDLMNEPVIGGGKGPNDWLVGEPLAGKYFVQRIALDVGKRTNEQVAGDWVRQMSEAIRRVDPNHLITVGVIPWAYVWPTAKPVFYTSGSIEYLDFVSVHFYPETNQIPKAITALKVYDLGKPIVIEEMFPLKCSSTELMEFVKESKGIATGWISFYWGRPIDELDQKTISGKITFDWLKAFQAESFRPGNIVAKFNLLSKRLDDHVDVITNEDTTEFSIRSPFGISSLGIERTEVDWPRRVVVKLHLKGLENMRISNGKITLEAAVSSQNEKPRVRQWKDKNEDSPLESDSPYWMEIRMIGSDHESTDIIPLDNGHFEIQLPKGMLEAQPKSIKIDWIDFYRG